MNEHVLLSDILLDAFTALDRVLEAVRAERLNHEEVVIREVVSAQTSVARVLHLIAGSPVG